MILLFYISTISGGGAARVMCNLVNMLSDRGHNCTLITSFKCDDGYYLSNKVNREYLCNALPSGMRLIKNISLIKKLHTRVLALRPDVLVSFLGEPNIRASLATIGTRTKTVLSVRNDPAWEYRGVIQTLLAKILFKHVDAIVFQTEDARQWFPKKIRNKGEVIFNSVKKEFYNVRLTPNRKGIVATGRLSKQKNHSLLIRAFSTVADCIDDDLFIYGPGDKEPLQTLAQNLGVQDRVHLPGMITDVSNTINSAKIYVLTSDFEGMPNALMEAMAMGLPCISTDCPCGGPRSLFSKEMFHFLSPVGDEKALASRMLELLSNDNARELHEQFCKRAALRFSPEIINDEWETFLLRVAMS